MPTTTPAGKSCPLQRKVYGFGRARGPNDLLGPRGKEPRDFPASTLDCLGRRLAEAVRHRSRIAEDTTDREEIIHHAYDRWNLQVWSQRNRDRCRCRNSVAELEPTRPRRGRKPTSRAAEQAGPSSGYPPCRGHRAPYSTLRMMRARTSTGAGDHARVLHQITMRSISSTVIVSAVRS